MCPPGKTLSENAAALSLILSHDRERGQKVPQYDQSFCFLTASRVLMREKLRQEPPAVCDGRVFRTGWCLTAFPRLPTEWLGCIRGIVNQTAEPEPRENAHPCRWCPQTG